MGTVPLHLFVVRVRRPIFGTKGPSGPGTLQPLYMITALPLSLPMGYWPNGLDSTQNVANEHLLSRAGTATSGKYQEPH